MSQISSSHLVPSQSAPNKHRIELFSLCILKFHRVQERLNFDNLYYMLQMWFKGIKSTDCFRRSPRSSVPNIPDRQSNTGMKQSTGSACK